MVLGHAALEQGVHGEARGADREAVRVLSEGAVPELLTQEVLDARIDGVVDAGLKLAALLGGGPLDLRWRRCLGEGDDLHLARCRVVPALPQELVALVEELQREASQALVTAVGAVPDHDAVDQHRVLEVQLPGGSAFPGAVGHRALGVVAGRAPVDGALWDAVVGHGRLAGLAATGDVLASDEDLDLGQGQCPGGTGEHDADVARPHRILLGVRGGPGGRQEEGEQPGGDHAPHANRGARFGANRPPRGLTVGLAVELQVPELLRRREDRALDGQALCR